ncbi:MAG: ROK family protein [Planctomycetota bacterium]
MGMRVAIGVDVGGTNIGAAVVTEKGRILREMVVPTKAREGKAAVIRRIADLACAVREKSGLPWKKILGVGVGVPGPVDVKRGILMNPPNLPGWKFVRLKDALEKRFPVPVVIENDANAAAFGEYWAGAGRKASSLAVFTLGTGIGGGLILNGEIWHGAHGTGAEFGHMTVNGDGVKCACPNIGCVEAYASSPATERRFAAMVNAGRRSTLAAAVRAGEEVTTKDIAAAARRGDAAAREALAESARYLAHAILTVIHGINPEKIVLTGGMIGAGDLLMKPLLATVRKHIYPRPARKTKITFAQLGDDAGVIGAGGCVFKKFASS